MALDGKSYLTICAARVFIGCSAPHFGNVLVTKAGELVSIDHCRGYFEKGDDLRELFYFVSGSFLLFRGENRSDEHKASKSWRQINPVENYSRASLSSAALRPESQEPDRNQPEQNERKRSSFRHLRGTYIALVTMPFPIMASTLFSQPFFPVVER
jgi:hypothetical protein